MESASQARPIIRAGDLDGLGTTYSPSGDLILSSGERIVKVAEGWDMDVVSPWRRILPKTVFSGFSGKTSSKLFVTTNRIVLIRSIDAWRELKGELTPLGLPAAAAKEVYLKRLKAAGAWQFCEIWPQALKVVKHKKLERRWSWLDLRLIGSDGKQYGVTLWKAGGLDPDTLTVLQSRFGEKPSEAR
jgi:hypothetical protein